MRIPSVRSAHRHELRLRLTTLVEATVVAIAVQSVPGSALAQPSTSPPTSAPTGTSAAPTGAPTTPAGAPATPAGASTTPTTSGSAAPGSGAGAASNALSPASGSTATSGTPVTAAATEAARGHYQRGIKFYTDGEFKLALVEFRRAYELSRNYRILYNIGQVNHQLSNYSNAIVALEQYLREGADGGLTDSRKAEVQRDIADLRAKVALVDVVVNVENAEIVVDDVVVGKAPLGGPITVDAGDHRIEARREGYRAASQRVTLAGRESIHVDLRLTEQKQVVVMAPAAATPGEKPRERSSTLEWVGWISTGVLAVGAGVTGFVAASDASRLASLRDSPSSTAAERESAQNQARGFAIATDVLAAAAVLTGATTLYFTLRSNKSQPKTEHPTRVGLGPTGIWLTHEY